MRRYDLATQEQALASSIAHSPSATPTAAQGLAESWVRGLGKMFRRVALFNVDGTEVTLVAQLGIARPAQRVTLSLHEGTPLRSAVLAASPVIGAGATPDAQTLFTALRIAPPRAYVVIPLISGRRIVALAYADRAEEPLPIERLSGLFDYLHRLLNPADVPRHRIHPGVRYARHRTRAVRAVALCAPARNTPTVLPPPLPPRMGPPPLPSVAPMPETPAAVCESTLLAPATLARIADGATSALDGIVTPVGVVTRKSERRSRWGFLSGLVLTCALAALGAAVLALAPVQIGSARERFVTVPQDSTVGTIATLLQEDGIIRSAAMFGLLARASGLDRALRAGSYHLSPGMWAWNVLAELRDGTVEPVTFTLPEGLTLNETTDALARAGLGSAEAFRNAASDPQLLATYGIPASNAEGYLFPETYTVARGLAPYAIIELMLQQFVTRTASLSQESVLSPAERHRRVILASIVEREAKARSELGRIAGVFHNRLSRNMKLESCATVQYVLGTPKERLLLEDVRTESPYNTYLNRGLPPGPIANPGLVALQAAFAPAKHDELFFFAKEDGSGEHIFSRTYAEHQERQRRLARH